MEDQRRKLLWLERLLFLCCAILLLAVLIWVVLWPSYLRYWRWPLLPVSVSALLVCLAFMGTRFGWSPQRRWPLVLALTLVLTAVLLGLGTYWPRQLPWATAASALVLLALALILILQRLSSTRQVSIVLVLLALGLYAGSLAYRAAGPARELEQVEWTSPQVMDRTAGHILRIAYPPVIPLEAQNEPGLPLSIYLWPPVVPLTPVPTGSTSSTSTGAATPAVTGMLSYTVAFEPSIEGLTFTDKDGVPVSPNVRVGPGQTADKPAVLYLHRISTESASQDVRIEGQIFDPEGRLSDDIDLDIRLEDTYGAWWRHLWTIALGPTTPLLALGAVLVGAGWQWWQEGEKRRQKALAEINEVEILANRDKIDSAKEELGEVTVRYGHERGLQTDLRKVRVAVWRARIGRLAIHAATGEISRCLDEKKRLQQEVAREAREDPDLGRVLEELDAAMQATAKRATSPWPALWQRERPPDAPAVAEWQKQVGLASNPFGPERAEEDPHLFEFLVEPPGWEVIKVPEPAVIFGADGSGRTALRLHLMRTCRIARLGQDRATGRSLDTFPVLVLLYPETDPHEAATIHWQMLTYAVAQATLDYLARNPDAFAETPAPQKRALARLLRMHRVSLGDPARYLERAGLDASIATHLAASIQEAGRGTRAPVLANQTELLAVLANARLTPFQQCYILVEIPDQVSIHYLPEEIAAYLTSLLRIVPALAARNIYLKLFIPADVNSQLEILPSRVRHAELSWDEAALRQILEQRVQWAGSPSFRALFGRLPSGADPATRLARAALAANGPPRQLVQLGQELLFEHVRKKPDDPRLRWEELTAVLKDRPDGRGP